MRVSRFALLTLVPGVALGAAPAAALADGELRQLPGTAGCVSLTGSSGQCATSDGLDSVRDVAVSPDGAHVYAIGQTSTAVVIFARAADGSLTRLPGTSGCIDDTATPTCADGRALAAPRSIAISPDGGSVYISGGGGLTTFDRAVDGRLTQKAGLDGCTSTTGQDGATPGVCRVGRAIGSGDDVTISPDGTSVYVGTFDDDAVAVFDRAPSGVLTQKAGPAGCIAAAVVGCATGTALDIITAVAVSPDGRSLYAAANATNAVLVFDRASDGSLTQKAGTAGCTSNDGTTGSCVDGVALSGPSDVTVSPDGASVYATSGNSSAVVVFDRAADGGLTQKAGTAGCVSFSGTGGSCATAPGLASAADVLVSRDGAHVYVTGETGAAIFDRSATGALTARSGSDGCVTTAAETPCAAVRGLSQAKESALAPDGTTFYLGGRDGDGVGVFERVLTATCAPATASTPQGTDVALTLSCIGPRPATVEVVTPPAEGSLLGLDPATGQVTYRPAPGQAPGTVTFTFRGRIGATLGPVQAAAISVTAPAAPPPGGGTTTTPTPGPTVTLPARPVVVLATSRLTARRGARITLPYGATTAGRLTLQVRRGTRVLQTLTRSTRAGRGTLRLRLNRTRVRRGTYTLRLVLRDARGATSTVTARLRVR